MSNFDAELCRKEMEFTRSGLKMYEIKIEQTFEELVGFGCAAREFLDACRHRWSDLLLQAFKTLF
jgi:hypothetical protein